MNHSGLNKMCCACPCHNSARAAPGGAAPLLQGWGINGFSRVSLAFLPRVAHLGGCKTPKGKAQPLPAPLCVVSMPRGEFKKQSDRTQICVPKSPAKGCSILYNPARHSCNHLHLWFNEIIADFAKQKDKNDVFCSNTLDSGFLGVFPFPSDFFCLFEFFCGNL